VDGLVIAGGNSTVRELVIDNFAAGYGLWLKGNGNDVVEGNFIGTDVTGLAAAGNNVGVLCDTPGNTIGGAGPGERNIISGNYSQASSWGVYLYSSGNSVLGDYIGTDR
jgi:titin